MVLGNAFPLWLIVEVSGFEFIGSWRWKNGALLTIHHLCGASVIGLVRILIALKGYITSLTAFSSQDAVYVSI